MQQKGEDPLVEKILSDLHRVIKKHPEICEFEIIPSAETQKNKSPVIHIGIHLGIEQWCIKQVYTYVHNTILALRKSKIHDINRLERLLFGGVLINPDVNTFWNMRRELVLDNYLNVQNELHLCQLILSHKPKSNELFSYREWIVQRILKTFHARFDDAQLYALVVQELDVANMAIQKAANNYHATNYKLFVVRHVAPLVSTYYEIIIQNELNRSEISMSKAVSDNSIFYYRQQILNILKEYPIHLDDKYISKFHLMLKQNICSMENNKETDLLIILLGKMPNLSHFTTQCLSNTLKVLLYELHYIYELNQIFPRHESLWYHRRYVVWELMQILQNFHDIKIQRNPYFFKDQHINTEENIIDQPRPRINHSRSIANQSFLEPVLLYRIIVENERNDLDGYGHDLEQMKHVERHKKWLLFNFNLFV